VSTQAATGLTARRNSGLESRLTRSARPCVRSVALLTVSAHKNGLTSLGMRAVFIRVNGIRSNNGPDRMTVKLMLKVCSVAALVLLVFVALGPAKWQPRSGIGWEFDHFIGYFVFTVMFCLAWPRPLVVGGALMAFAVLLEGLQAFMPDRSSYYVAALYSAGGVLGAALLAELFIRGQRRFQSKWADGNT
jgi:VanZ family protein